MRFAEIKQDVFSVLPLVLHTVGESEKQPPVYRPDGFEWHEFIWVKSGNGIFTVREESFFLTEGKGIFIRKDIPHTYTGDGAPLHTRWCTFSSDDRILDYSIGEREYILFDCPPFLEGETDSLIRIANSSGSLLARSAAGYSYVSDLLLNITEASVPTDAKIVDYLESHYAEPLLLDDVAEALGTDKYILCHVFREKRGCGIMEYLKKIRIAKAKRFLRYGGEGIAEIGSMCGFESASYFIKRFREECGCTPGEYRRRHTAEPLAKH